MKIKTAILGARDRIQSGQTDQFVIFFMKKTFSLAGLTKCVFSKNWITFSLNIYTDSCFFIYKKKSFFLFPWNPISFLYTLFLCPSHQWFQWFECTKSIEKPVPINPISFYRVVFSIKYKTINQIATTVDVISGRKSDHMDSVLVSPPLFFVSFLFFQFPAGLLDQPASG